MNFGSALEQVHRRAPLVDCITNFVTVNDCANILLACGASPIMADSPSEAEEITAASQALVLPTHPRLLPQSENRFHFILLLYSIDG